MISAMSGNPNEGVLAGTDEELVDTFTGQTQENNRESIHPTLDNMNFMPYEDVLGSIGEEDLFGDINPSQTLGQNIFHGLLEQPYGPQFGKSPQHIDPSLLVQTNYAVPVAIPGASHLHPHGDTLARNPQLAYSAPAAPFNDPFYGGNHGLLNSSTLGSNTLHGTFSPAGSSMDQPVFSPKMGAHDFPAFGFIQDMDYTTTSSRPTLLLEEPPIQRVNPPKDGRQTDDEYIEISRKFVHLYADFDAVKRKLNEIKGIRSQDIHDDTYPTTSEDQRMYVKRIFLATRDGRTAKTFRQGRPVNKQPQAYNLCVLLKGKDEDGIQLKCWEWLVSLYFAIWACYWTFLTWFLESSNESPPTWSSIHNF